LHNTKEAGTGAHIRWRLYVSDTIGGTSNSTESIPIQHNDSGKINLINDLNLILKYIQNNALRLIPNEFPRPIPIITHPMDRSKDSHPTPHK
jgi:hypothetical protein